MTDLESFPVNPVGPPSAASSCDGTDTQPSLEHSGIKPLRIFVVADVGGPDQYHLGDEAMLEANLQMFRQLVPEIEFTVLSRNPAWTSRRYRVEALPTMEIPSGYSAESWTRKVAEAPGAARWRRDWLGEKITASLRESSGLVVSGGGNLSATWPDRVLERVALLEHAQDSGIPSVILGQTLGPSLSPEQRRLLSGPLQRAKWLGVRDESSAAIALSLGASDNLHRQLDDAFFMDSLAVNDDRARDLRGQRHPWIIVTLDASFAGRERARSLSMLANQLDALADYLHATLVFVPHTGGADGVATLTDVDTGRALASHLRSKLVLLNPWEPREVRWLIEQAGMVVSTRYHPLVFATATGVASLGIYTDDYTRIKLCGALAVAGLEGWCLPLASAEGGEFLPLATELWSQRSSVADRLASLHSGAWSEELRRWEEICQALLLEPKAKPKSPDMPACFMNRVALPRKRELLPITDEQWRQYEQRGYLRLGKLLSEPELAALQERLDGIMLGKVRYPMLEMQLDTGGAYEDLPEAIAGFHEATLAYRKVQGLQADPLVLELIRRDVFREICARHYGRHASISMFRVMMMNKPAGRGTYLPWHQDAGDVWKLDRDPVVTTWIAIDAATRRNGCVQVIPGSHHLGLLSKNGSTLTAAHMKLYCPDEAVEYLELEAGEALLLHNWLLHRSDVNQTGTSRRALSVCYMDGRTLNTLTGTRFPIVFGEYEDAGFAMPVLRGLKEDNRRLREIASNAEQYSESLLADNRLRERMRCEAEQYARSLLEDNRRLEQMRREAEQYAKSLLDENQRREQMWREAERYAGSLEEELVRIRGIVAQTSAA